MKSKKSIASILYLTFIICLNSSCTHKYYAPNDGEFLILTKRNDLHVSQSISGGNLNSASTQLGYSPIKYLGLSGSFFNMKGSSSNSSGNIPLRRGDGKIWNTSIGGYYLFNFKKQSTSRRFLSNSHSPGILADFYLGYGKGEVNNFYEVGGSTHFKFDKRYAQLGIYLISKRINFGYQFRLGNLNYFEGEILGQAIGLTMEGFNFLTVKNDFRLKEHSLQLSYGVKQFRVFIRSTGVENNFYLDQLGIKETNTTIGLILEIDEVFRKIKSKEVEKKVDF